MKVEYIDHMGSDERVVDAARVSFEKIAANYTEEQNNKLIKYLATHNHWTPFSHCIITLRETIPIFVARERFRHTVGFTYNEVSRRYVDTSPDFYVPYFWRERSENKKQGSGDRYISTLELKETAVWDDYTSPNISVDIHEYYNSFLDYAESFYRLLIENNVAPEQARMVLPQSMYTSYYVTGSLAAFARAYRLRSSPDAQKEIQELASQWDQIIKSLYPNSWEALVGERV